MLTRAQHNAHLVQSVQQEGQQLLAVLLRIPAELGRKLGQLRVWEDSRISSLSGYTSARALPTE